MLTGHFKRLRDHKHVLHRQRWAYVFFTLLALLILYPFLEGASSHEPTWILKSLNLVIVVAIVWAVSYRRQQLIVALSLGIPLTIFSWFRCGVVGCSFTIQFLTALFSFLLYLYVVWLLAWDHGRTYEISMNEIYQVATLFFLVALAFASLFHIVEMFHPGSFRIVVPNMDTHVGWSELFFLSFCTITTLGYGDIIPFTQHARSLALLEVFIGIMFIAVIFARAISLYTTQAFLRKEIPIEVVEPPDKRRR